MKITNFDRSNLKELRKSFEETIKAFETKHGLKCELGTIRFSGDEFSAKLNVKTTSNKPVVKNNVIKVGSIFQVLDVIKLILKPSCNYSNIPNP